MERRWLIGLGPPLLAAIALGAVLAPGAGAADRAWQPPPCPDGPSSLPAAATGVPGAAGPFAAAWFTLDPRLDDAGTLAGQRLRLGLGDQRARYLDLPAESTAAGPFGRIVLVVADDEHRSDVRALDAARRCWWSLGSSTDVIRDVTLDPAGTAVWEFRVDRTTRADLGIWRRGLDGGPAQPVLPAPPDDDRFGRTWSTSLGWTLGGDELIVESCGEHQCRSRVVDPATAQVRWLDEHDTGRLLGIAEGIAVTYAACDVLPCPIVATDIVSGDRRVIAAAAGAATLVATPHGPRTVLESPAGAEIRRLDGALERVITPPEPSLQLVSSVLGGTSGAGLPPDWLAWSVDGRSPRGAALTRLSDDRTIPVAEVQP